MISDKRNGALMLDLDSEDQIAIIISNGVLIVQTKSSKRTL
jgi:hypothetical protein